MLPINKAEAYYIMLKGLLPPQVKRNVTEKDNWKSPECVKHIYVYIFNSPCKKKIFCLFNISKIAFIEQNCKIFLKMFRSKHIAKFKVFYKDQVNIRRTVSPWSER